MMITFGAISAASAADLSKYRQFQLGSDISTVAKQAGTSVSDAKTIHRRPVVIQEIQWRPGSSGDGTQTESAKDVVLSFLDGQLFQITVKYDRYDTEGLTNEDMVEAISTTYGSATTPPARVNSAQGSYGDEEMVIARWQDLRYRFDLIRSSYGPSFRLAGVLKQMEVPAQAGISKAVKLDEQEAPRREAARVASDARAAGAKLDKARAENKPKFRP
jgi:hypothetical protein